MIAARAAHLSTATRHRARQLRTHESADRFAADGVDGTYASRDVLNEVQLVTMPPG